MSGCPVCPVAPLNLLNARCSRTQLHFSFVSTQRIESLGLRIMQRSPFLLFLTILCSNLLPWAHCLLLSPRNAVTLAAINELNSLYSFSLDEKNFDTLADVYTVDAVLDGGAATTIGARSSWRRKRKRHMDLIGSVVYFDVPDTGKALDSRVSQLLLAHIIYPKRSPSSL